MGLGSIVSAGVMRLIPFDKVISTMLDTDIIPLMMEKGEMESMLRMEHAICDTTGLIKAQCIP